MRHIPEHLRYLYVYVCLTVIKKSSSLSLYDDVFEISNYTYLAYTALFLKVNDSSINNTMTSCEFFCNANHRYII